MEHKSFEPSSSSRQGLPSKGKEGRGYYSICGPRKVNLNLSLFDLLIKIDGLRKM